ncbi:hypothetical protein CARUB_v10028384mg [Capsella rubella]|uniref:Embryo sac development arrest 6 n=1 Tax=Capsella rubella TaxID=81985 RepID=R0GRT1_9BRAS|nr:uncharacterized protein LOC17874742 [Capsella rubella]EOA15030.1 hypothetical protein CARUB_v10028384mg [Capsella rubella]
MNTKTMRLPPRRVISGTVAGKQTETVVKNPPPPTTPIKSILKKTPFIPHPSPPTTTAAVAVVAEPGCSNQLLAGYLAHEFLNEGTLFGELWNPSRAQAGPFTAQLTETKRTKPSHHDIEEPSDQKRRRRYVEVANILRVDGAHLPGIVNPSQLARFLKS